MKVTISSIFDIATVSASKAAQELSLFFEHYNRSIDEIVKILKGRLTFQDNFQGQQVVIEMVHNTQTKVSINRPQVLGVIPLSVASSTDALTNLVTSVNQDRQLLVTPQFKLGTSTKINVTLFILFPNEG